MNFFKTDEEKALEFYEKAEEYYKNEEYELMIPYYEKAADLGHLQSMHCLGYSYQNGQGVNANDEKAYYWYSMAANKGFVKSIHAVGVCRFYGKGVAQDKEQGLEDMEYAASKGYSVALFKLGEMYYTGDGVLKREKIGINYMAKAAVAKSKKAIARLSEILEDEVFVEDDWAETDSSYFVHLDFNTGNAYAAPVLIDLYKNYGFLTQSDQIFDELVDSALKFDAEAADCIVKYLLEKDKEIDLYAFFLRLFYNVDKFDAHTQAFDEYIHDIDKVKEEINKFIAIIAYSLKSGYEVTSGSSFCCGCGACEALLDATGFYDLTPEFHCPTTQENKLKYYVAANRCPCFNISVEEV